MNRVPLHTRIGLCAFTLVFAVVPGGSADPPKKGDAPPAAQLDLDELVPHPDLDWLRRAKVPTDDAGLVRFLNSLRGREADPAEVERLVRALSGGTRDEAEAAAKALTDLGAVAVPALRRHRLGPDPAGAARVRACLEKIEEAADRPLARPAMRRLVMRKAAGAADALLGYVPFAFDPAAAEDAWYGLDELAATDPKVLAMLAVALSDKQPARRAVAACILGRRGNATQKAAVRTWLGDPDPEVRLRAAQGLLAGKHAAGVPTLIDLLTDPAIEVRWQSEELLRWLAGDAAPELVVGAGDPKAAEACQAAWRTWWKDQGEKADMAAAEREPRRPMLLLAYARKDGRAWVVGCDGVTRHAWTGLDRLADAQYVPGACVLTLHEQVGNTKPVLAERSLSGEAHWQHTEMKDPRYCQRLSNGHVFVAEAEVDSTGFDRLRSQVVAPGPRVAATHPKTPQYADAVRQTADGKVICAGVWNPAPNEFRFSNLRVYDPASDTLRSVGDGTYLIGDKVYLEPVPDGGYLVSGLHDRSAAGPRPLGIVEYDLFGEKVWRYLLAGVSHAYRLRGGTTLACASDRLVELTPDRRMVGETPVSPAPEVARPCLSLVRFGFDTFPADFDLESDIDYRVRSVQRNDPRARRWALAQLAAFGPAAAYTIPKLQAHQDSDPAVREAVKKTLRALGEEEIPRLIADAKQADVGKRFKAITELRKYRGVPGAVDTFLAALADEDPKVRAYAANGLGLGGAPNPQSRLPEPKSQSRSPGTAERVVPALIKLIATDKDPMARLLAIQSLGGFGRGAERAVPLLINLVKDDQDPLDARCYAVAALGRIADGDPDVLKVLYAALADAKHPPLQSAAASTLSTFKAPAEEKVRRFLAAFPKSNPEKDPNVNFLRTIIRSSLWRLDAARPDVIRFYTAMAEDPSGGLSDRLYAAERLFLLGKREAAVNYLKKWIAEWRPFDQAHAQERLRQLHRQASLARWKDE
jgi:HEAT repeat protein